MAILKNINRAWTIGRDRVSVSGSFRPNGATGVVSGSQTGTGYSVARTSQGLYTVTFDRVGHQLDSVVASARSADGIPLVCVPGDYSKANKTLQLRVQHPGAGHIPLDITALREIASNDIQNLAAVGGIMASDSTPALARVNGATDKALRLAWAAADVTEVAFPPVAIPRDLTGAATVHLYAGSGGTTDAPTIDVQAFVDVGDTEMGTATGAVPLSPAYAEVTAALTATNLGGHPGFLNLSLVPAAHGTDALYVYAAWIEYDRLVDLASDADNVVNFSATFKNSKVANET